MAEILSTVSTSICFFWQNYGREVRTVDLMKKGLRQVDTSPARNARQNRRPDEEGIKTPKTSVVPPRATSEP